MVDLANNAIKTHPETGAFLLECSNLLTFANDIQLVVNKPVFDYMGFVDMIYHSVVQRTYHGFRSNRSSRKFCLVTRHTQATRSPYR